MSRAYRNEIVSRRDIDIRTNEERPEGRLGATVSVFERGTVILTLGEISSQFSLHMNEADALAIAEALTGAVAEAPAGRRKLDEDNCDGEVASGPGGMRPCDHKHDKSGGGA